MIATLNGRHQGIGPSMVEVRARRDRKLHNHGCPAVIGISKTQAQTAERSVLSPAILSTQRIDNWVFTFARDSNGNRNIWIVANVGTKHRYSLMACQPRADIIAIHAICISYGPPNHANFACAADRLNIIILPPVCKASPQTNGERLATNREYKYK
jgi:hypothetical protein